MIFNRLNFQCLNITNLHNSVALIVTFVIVVWLWWIKIPWNDPKMSAN